MSSCSSADSSGEALQVRSVDVVAAAQKSLSRIYPKSQSKMLFVRFDAEIVSGHKGNKRVYTPDIPQNITVDMIHTYAPCDYQNAIS